MIADETGKHVRATQEKEPLVGRFFKNRGKPVLPPGDLVKDPGGGVCQ
ncbi:MAG: hypothetical protein HPY55_13065 [Firmicutes bacterium]|nr:hypothetical protein [Bacillota bacterium]